MRTFLLTVLVTVLLVGTGLAGCRDYPAALPPPPPAPSTAPCTPPEIPEGEAGVWTDCFCTREGLCWEHPRPTGADLEHVTVTDEETAFLSGASVVRRTRDGWQRLEVRPPDSPIHLGWRYDRIVAFSEDDAWIGGSRLLRWDGERVVEMHAGDAKVAGTRPDDVWVTTAAGEIWRWNGEALQPVPPPDDGQGLREITAFGSAVWVTGGERQLFEWTGTGWSALSPFPHDLQGEPAPGPSPAFACSEDEVWSPDGGFGFVKTFTRWHDGTWEHLPTPGLLREIQWLSAAGASCDDVTLIGANGEVARWDGEAMHITDDLPFQLRGADATSPDNVWAVGLGGAVLRFDGETWRELSQGAGGPTVAVARRPGRTVVARRDGLLEQSTGEWKRTEPAEPRPRAVDFLSPDDGWRVGEQGSAARWNGSRWVEVPTGVASHLLDVDARAPDDAWAVGLNGTVLRFDGSAWNALPADPALDLAHVSAVSGGAWLAGAPALPGDRPALQRVTAAGVETPPLDGLHDGIDIRDLWARSLDDAWIATGSGLFHFDGTGWTRERRGPFSNVGGWGPEVFATSLRLHVWDGAAWTELFPVSSTSLDVHAGVVALVGIDGSVVRRVDGVWSEATAPRGAQLDWVVSAAVVSPTELWLVSRQYLANGTAHDLFRWRDGTLQRALAVPPGSITGLAFDDDGNLWGVGPGGALQRHDAGRWTPGPELTLVDLRSLTRSFDGSLLASGEDGVVLEHRDGAWSALPLADRDVHEAWRLTDGSVVARGGHGAVGALDAQDWRWPGLGESSTSDIAVSPDGRVLWRVSGRELQRCVDGACVEHSPPFSPVSVLLDDELWVARARHHLVRFDGEGFEDYPFEGSDGVASWRAADGTRYFAFATGGIARYYPPAPQADAAP